MPRFKMNKKFISIIAAFLFSVVLWGSVSLSSDYFVSVLVPVRVVDVPNNYVSDAVSTREVFLRLKGEGWKLSSITLGSDLEYKVSAAFDSGKVFMNLNKSISANDWLTSGIQVYDISPDTISTRIEKLYQKTVRILPAIELHYKPEYGLASPVKITPDSVIVFGTKRRLKDLEGIPTVKTAFSDLERKTVERIDLTLKEGLTYNLQNTTITFDVQKIVDKSFSGINVEILNVPEARDLILFPNKISIVLRGGINVLGKMNDDAIRALVDYNIILEDTTGTIEPVIAFPDNTVLVNKNPNRIKYIIKKY